MHSLHFTFASALGVGHAGSFSRFAELFFFSSPASRPCTYEIDRQDIERVESE